MIHAIVNNSRLILAKVIQRLFFFLPDKLYLQIVFRLEMGYKLNLKNPQTFSEKLQWLKLYNRKPEYTTMVDKASAKEYVAKIIGEEYIIPTLGVWDRFEDIDFDSLPNQFVLKTTHGGGNTGVVICKDKSSFDKESAKARLNKSLKSCIYRRYKEWPYKNVKHRIIAEEYITDSNGELNDYKFFCFNGKVKFCQVISSRNSVGADIDWFNLKWERQPFQEPKKYPHSKKDIAPPKNLQLMVEMAEMLSSGAPFLRVDFYDNGFPLFGELTFFPTSGMGGFSSIEWDYKFGEWIKLPH